MKLGRPSQAVQRADKVLAKDADNRQRTAPESPGAAGCRREGASPDRSAEGARPLIPLRERLASSWRMRCPRPATRPTPLTNTRGPGVRIRRTRMWPESSLQFRWRSAATALRKISRVKVSDSGPGTSRQRQSSFARKSTSATIRGRAHAGPACERQRRLGRLARAAGDDPRGRENDEAARASFLKALQVDRDSLEALAGLVGVEVRAHHLERVRSRVDQAAARHPRDPRLPPPDSQSRRGRE